MLGHLGINVPDLQVAKAYYDQIMPLVGFEEFLDGHDEFAYCPVDGKRGTFIFFYPATRDNKFSRDQPGLQHLAFMVKTRRDVETAHQLAMHLGSEEIHAPQRFPQYPPPYYATFWLDPFGIMIEAVCHYDQ